MKRFISPPAIFLYVVDAVNGNLVTDPNNPFHITLVTTNNEEIERVRICGVLVDKYYSPGEEGKKAYCALVIDDGTDTMRVKGWEEDAEHLNSFEIGHVLDIIGKPRGNNEELYLSSEIVAIVEDYNQEVYLRTIRANRYIKKKLSLPKITTDDVSEDLIAAKELVWSIIIGESEGIAMDDLLARSKLDKSTLEAVMQDLLNSGEVYEPSALVFKKI